MKLLIIIFFPILLSATSSTAPPPPKASSGLICGTCESFIETMRVTLKEYAPGQETGQMLIGLCSSFFGYVPLMERQCKTCLTEDLDSLRNALENNESAKSICGQYLKLC